MNKFIGWSLAVIIIMIASACEDDDSNVSRMNATDREFVVNAAAANRAEIELGGIAATMAASDGVKKYGKMMEDSHRKTLNELELMADKPIPYSMSADHRTMVQQLSGLSGNALDSTYMHNQISAHQKTITLYEGHISSGTDQRLKDYATRNLADARIHLFKADSIINVMEN